LPEEPTDEIEVALVGRSNVGKSSLLNALANSYGERTARVSDKPGETQAVTFFRVGKVFRLVDLPGYGFAFANDETATKMSTVMRAYLEQRKALKHVVLLVDARHGFKAADTEMAQWLHKHCKAKLHVCLTKCDTVEPDQLKRVASLAKEDAAKFTKEPLLLVSALKKQGIDVLRREIARFAVPSVYRKLILRFQRRDDAALGNENRGRRRGRSGGRRRARRTAHSQEEGEARSLPCASRAGQ
jgi:ribosome biogenesis GTP-binding protein YsxC/EngB